MAKIYVGSMSVNYSLRREGIGNSNLFFTVDKMAVKNNERAVAISFGKYENEPNSFILINNAGEKTTGVGENLQDILTKCGFTYDEIADIADELSSACDDAKRRVIEQRMNDLFDNFEAAFDDGTELY